MNPFGFLSAHMLQIGALLVAALLIFIAKKVIPFIRNKDKGVQARWAAFVTYALAGIALAVAMVPLILWLVGLGNRSGFSSLVGNITAIVSLALGWHSVAMIVSVVRDLMDKVPDHEARSGALWIPTFAPIGFAAVWQLVQNPSSLGQGLTAAIMAGITLMYAYKIAGRADAATTHQKGWSWFSFGVFLLAGLSLIPLVRFLNTAIIEQLPSTVSWIPQLILGGLGIAAVIVGACELWFNNVAEKWARNGAAYGLGAAVVFGGVAMSWLSSTLGSGTGILNGAF